MAMKYTFTLGLFQFEEIKVDPIIVKETGQNTYNVKFSFHFGGEGDEYVEYGIISEGYSGQVIQNIETAAAPHRFH